MSKWNESKCDFDKLKKCIKEFEDGLEKFENNLEEQLALLRQRPAEFKDDLIGLVHLMMDRSNHEIDDVRISEEKTIIIRFKKAYIERLSLMHDLCKKREEFDFSTVIEKSLSIDPIAEGDVLNHEK